MDGAGAPPGADIPSAGKLLPDRQPAYLASWVYVSGVGALAALGVVIVSGFALALGGPGWWHTSLVLIAIYLGQPEPGPKPGPAGPE